MKSSDSKETANRAKSKKRTFRGVISSIISMIENSGEVGINKAQILEALIRQFPDRPAEALRKTVSSQVPSRISKKKFAIERLENGNYRKK